MGSAITYARRYALGAALSLNIDEDDDAQKATVAPVASNPTIIVDYGTAIKKINAAKTQDELKAVWISFTKDEQKHPNVVTAKETRKSELAANQQP